MLSATSAANASKNPSSSNDFPKRLSAIFIYGIADNHKNSIFTALIQSIHRSGEGIRRFSGKDKPFGQGGFRTAVPHVLSSACQLCDSDGEPGGGEGHCAGCFFQALARPQRASAGVFRGGSIRSFLLRSTYNAAISVIRHNLSSLNHRDSVAREIEEYYSGYDVDRSEILRTLYSRDIRSVLDTAISGLPPRCREVFLLSYVENLSNREISERLGLSLSTVENHIHNALVRLRAALSAARD